ncbi:hypothetical protein ACOACO_10170 [Nocardioides sp. CPCC 205120]|uniref:hypothetical protein n=1 Tax=Nocardioides sp. CPCC 205120 TaxID=3406462 RepID=UPI003B5027F3
MRAFLRTRTLAAVVGLACGTLAALGVRQDIGGPDGPRDDLAPGDVLQQAMDAWAAGDHVVVAPGSSALLDPAAESAIEEVIAEEGAPLYVLVVAKSWNAGYAQAGHALDQVMANVEVEGVVAIWEGNGDGDVALTGHRSLPPSYRLEEAGVALAPEDVAIYDEISSYGMVGQASARLDEWARAIPPDITDVEDTTEPRGSTRRGDTVLGAVVGTVVGLVGGGVVWGLIGIVRVRSGRSFTNVPVAAGSSPKARPVEMRKPRDTTRGRPPRKRRR